MTKSREEDSSTAKASRRQDKEPSSSRRRLLEALSGLPEVAVERPRPVPSAARAISSSIQDLTSERQELRETIVYLEERLAISESLVGELRKELARRDGRYSVEQDPSGV